MRRHAIASRLLAWYEDRGRELPWRIGPAARQRGARPDPYRIWLSEVMLQQTTVAAVVPYFRRFMARWPTVHALAVADPDAVMAAWAGLGYYSRARNLIVCAKIIAADRKGVFPDDPAELKALPGIGPYTSAAIAAIAFDRSVAVVDGNVERVVSRLFAIDTPMPAAKKAIRASLEPLVPERRPGEFAEALMDLGATVCAPRSAQCGCCPLENECAARANGNPTGYPVKAARRARPQRHGIAYVALREDGAVLLRRRPPTGLLGGMAEVPGTPWRAADAGTAINSDAARPLLASNWQALPVSIVHGFTHFTLTLSVETATVPASTPAPTGCWWAPVNRIDEEALPTVMRKVIKSVLDSPARLAADP